MRKFDTASHRRRARASHRRAAREQCRRAGGAARRRQDHAGAAGAARRAVGGQENPGAGAAPARRPRRRQRAWPRRWASRSATRWACACASVRRLQTYPHRGRQNACSRGWCSTILPWTALPPCCSTEFHERSFDADLGLALARDVQHGLARGLKSTGDVGDPRRRPRRSASWQCAGDRQRRPRLCGRDRYLGRDQRTPIERQMADVYESVGRAGVPA